MKKQLLLIIATHGNEKIGLETAKILESNGLEKYFDVLIANPKALDKNVRFIEADLNRSYPGNKTSKLYEQKIACDNLKVAKKYKYIIDIHEANRGTDDFIIAPRYKLPKKFPLKYIDLRKVLLWPNPKGPISQILDNSIELEFGMRDRDRIKAINKAVKIIGKFIKNIYSPDLISIAKKKEIYYVYDKLLVSPNNPINFETSDFSRTKINDEIFYPLLTNQYIEEGIICYKMKKLI